MKIESLSAKADRAGRFLVRFDDGTAMRLYRRTVEDFGLFAGAQLDAAQFEKLRANAEEVSAKMRAVRIIAASNVSKKELKRRLIQKGEGAQQASDAVQWLEEHDLLDDAKTAAQIVSRCAAKGYGISRAKQALYEKRIPKEYWDEALADYPEQTDAIVSFLRARLGDDADERAVRRATDALLRRGHTYGEIRKAMEILTLETEDFSED